MITESIGKNKLIVKNTGLLFFRMLLSMGVSLYTSRIVLNVLGVTDFGIYNVVGGVVVMFGFINHAMTAATQRFLTFELANNNKGELRNVFSMSVTIHAMVALIVLLIAETVGLWILNTKLNIPVERLIAANWVYQFSILAFLITVLNVPYDAIIVSHEKMNVYAYVSIFEVLLKLLIVFILLWLQFDKLIFYSILVFGVSLIIRSIYFIYCKNKFPETSFHFFWNRKLFKEMSSFASWNLFGVFAGIAYGQGVNILLNIFFGPVVNAARGIAFQVQSSVNAFVTNFQVAVNPQIVKSYATGEKEYMYSLVFNASKYSFYLLYILCLPIIIETEFILKLWLKITPSYTIVFTRLVLIDVLICSLSGPLQTMVQATGNIRRYQILVSGVLLLNLPVSYVMLHFGFPPQITFVISIVVSALALITRILVLRKLESFPIRKFFLSVLFRVIVVLTFASIFPYFISTLISNPILRFIAVLIGSLISCTTCYWFLGINKKEKLYIERLIYKSIKL